jgi:hypothetical protein
MFFTRAMTAVKASDAVNKYHSFNGNLNNTGPILHDIVGAFWGLVCTQYLLAVPHGISEWLYLRA